MKLSKYTLTDEEYQEILAFKRDMHMHPELSGAEFETTQKDPFIYGVA